MHNVPGAFSSGTPAGEDFRIVLEEILRVGDGGARVPRPYPYGWTDAGDIMAGPSLSLAWRCLDAQFWGLAQRRKRIFLLADFAGPSAPALLFDTLQELYGQEEESERGTVSRAGRSDVPAGPAGDRETADAEKAAS